MLGRMRSTIATIVILVFALAACGASGDATGGLPTDTATSSATLAPTVAPVTAEPVPEADPAFAWALDGDGTASVGGVDLEFGGGHAFSPEAVALDGYTGNGVSAGPGPVDTTHSFSVAAWVRLAGRADIAAAVSQLAAQTAPFQLGVGEGKWWFMMKTEDRTGLEFSVSAKGSVATPAPAWVHLVGTYDRDAGVIQLFLNGKRAAFAPFTTPVKADGPLAIGRAQFDGNPGNFWPGAVGDVAIYQTTLSPAQVAKIYASTKPASDPPPQPAPDPSTYANGLLNGTWDHVFGKADADVMVKDFAGYVDSADEVIVRLGIDRNTWWIGFLFDGKLILENGVPEGARGTLSIEGAALTLHEGGSVDTTWAWKLNGGVLTLEAISSCVYTEAGSICTDDRDKMEAMELLVVEHEWIKSGDDPSY